jgi:uncharacterized membrane protein YecN with MAPEG domain
MVYPATTAFYAAILALIYFGLTCWVVSARFKQDVLHGDGGSDTLARRIRSHANFAEYVPFILILAAFLEAGGAGAMTIRVLLVPLIVARLMHPVGMVARKGSTQQYAFRATGAIITWVVLVASAFLVLLRY